MMSSFSFPNDLNKSITAGWNVNGGKQTPPPPPASSARRVKMSLNTPIQSPREASPVTLVPNMAPAAEQPEAAIAPVELAATAATDPSTAPPVAKRSRSSRQQPSTSRQAGLAPRSGNNSGDRASLLAQYPPPSNARLSNLGGLEPQITQLLEIVALPLLHPEIYRFTGIKPPRGVLLHGVPGGGKTRLVTCLAGELGLPFISIAAPSLVSSLSGDTEKQLRQTFEDAKTLAPCILFLDEVDAITPKRETAQREMEKRIVGQLLTSMDELSEHSEPVIILAATNRPDSLDPALRRAGRFDNEIEMGVPSVEGREEILRVMCSSLRLAGDIDFRALAMATPGYVGADLTALTGAAGVVAVKRIFQQQLAPPPEDTDMITDQQQQASTDQQQVAATVAFSSLPTAVQTSPIATFLLNHPGALTNEQLAPIHIIPSDFAQALKMVQPSAKREGFATVPDVTWADIGALHGIRDELHMAIVQPIRRPELFKMVGIDAPSGVLLWGPPGCGKTLLAKAVANESRANFISVKGPELLNKYVGESERAVRQVFVRARASSPCVIFFDELDALVPRRDDSMSESSARVVNTLLTELDGLDSRKAVYVVGATNRPDMIDPAMVRPGRLDKLLYVDLPTPSERVEILKTHLAKTPLQQESWEAVSDLVRSDKCDGFSGADLASLVREASTLALRSALESVGAFENDEDRGDDEFGATNEAPTARPAIYVTTEHFAKAATKTMPSVSREQKRKYEALRNKFAGLPVKANKKWMEAEKEDAKTQDAAKMDGGSNVNA